MSEIFHRVQIRTPQAPIVRALTEQAGLARWWTTETKAQPEVGSMKGYVEAGTGTPHPHDSTI